MPRWHRNLFIWKARFPDELREDNARTFTKVTREPFRVRPPVHAIVNGSLTNVLGSGSINWIHLPANNMSWVESLMKTLYRDAPRGEDEQIPYDEIILNSQNWAGRQNNDLPRHHQARFMRPTCLKLPTAPGDDSGRHESNMVFFIPYLHWEADLARLRTCHITRDIEQRQDLPYIDEELLDLQCNVDEKLLRKYLNSPSPLHVRRTLNQAYYYTPTDTYTRDRNQVTLQYVKNNPLNNSSPHVLMVDQCWLWVLGDVMVTCFPGCWVEDGNPEADDPIDVLEKIVQQLSRREIYETISSSLDLAAIIIDNCAGNMVNSNLDQSQDRERFHFLEWFHRSIRRVMADQFCDDSRRLQTTLEKVISAIRNRENGKSLPDDYEEWEEALNELQQPATGGLSDITQEIANLREIKDISDELHMIEDIISQQQRSLKMFDDVVRRKKWISEKLLQKTQNRKATIEQLHKDASYTYSWIVDLLDLKQKQTNVSEARSSRFQAELANKQAEQAALQAIETTKQGKSIMLFTTVTILFLPLSTVASLFSLNAKELNGGNLRIGVVFAYLFPISFFFVFFALLLAFHTGLRQICTLYAQIGLAYLDQATGFSKIVRQDNDERVEELKTRLEMIKARARGGYVDEPEHTDSTSSRSVIDSKREIWISRWRRFVAHTPWWAVRRAFWQIFWRRPHTANSSDRTESLVVD